MMLFKYTNPLIQASWPKPY